MRLLLITNVYPTPIHPTKGVFNRSLVEALRVHHSVRVIVPVAWTDLLRRRRGTGPAPAPDPELIWRGYFYTPGILRRHYAGFLWNALRSLVRREIATYHPDAVLGYWAHPDGAVALRAAREAGVPGVVMVGGSDVLLLTQEPARREVILDVLLRADAVVAIGADLTQKLVSLGVPADRVHAFARGVDRERFVPGDRALAKRTLGLDPGTPLLLWVGRMVEVKDLDLLLAALASIADRAWQFALVGDGPLRSSLEAAVARRGLSARVRFAGPTPHADLPVWYRAASLTVLSSRSEGTPNVLIESVACGTPFISTSVGSVPHMVSDPRALVPAGDAAALAAAIGAALASPPPLEAYHQAPEQAASAEMLVQLIERLRQARRVVAA